MKQFKLPTVDEPTTEIEARFRQEVLLTQGQMPTVGPSLKQLIRAFASVELTMWENALYYWGER